MPSTKRFIACCVLCLPGLVGLMLAQPDAPSAGSVAVELELGQEFFYEEDPLNLRVSIRNRSDDARENPVRTGLFSSFKVRRLGGEILEPVGEADVAEPARPEELSPGGFYGAVLDLGRLYPALRASGVFEIYWSGHGLISRKLRVTIIPRFDPAKAYRAVVRTSLGPVTIELIGQQSPIAVKSFVDMARVGVYDGTIFHEVHPDSHVVGGDPRFSDRPARSVTFPAELGPVPLVAGTVALRPVSAAPPANGPAFMILVKPQPTWTGQLTVLGRVIDGLDVVRRASNVPSSGRTSRPFFEPVTPITIDTVEIVELAVRQAAPSAP